MQNYTSGLISQPPGTVFQIVDDVLLDKFPKLRGEFLTLSIAKKSGPRTYIQYNLNGVASTLKLLVDYEIQIQGKQEMEPLASLIRAFKFSDRRPSHVRIRGNNEELIYKIDSDFWDQNSQNIRLKGLSQFGQKYKIPGAWEVTEKIFN